jgi:glycosyltransferase involved in cell wall biosynthesis
VAVVGTFYNTNWFLSHAVPLTHAGIDELVVVTDEPQAALPGVRFVCPPRWAAAAFGRTVAKLACLMLAGLRYRPALYMGYHVIPGGVVALLTARAFGRPAVYQMTGGPLEVAGGGFGSENPVLARLGRPRPRLERLALRLVREFDQVIVRGPGARAFLVERGVSERAVAIIPGSVDPRSLVAQPERTLDLVFVGRLVELKQPLQFVEILAAVAEQRPSATGLMVGGGPLLGAIRERAVALGVADRLRLAGKSDDVPQILGRSRVFVLTSRSEGLSIAMAEAMMAGVVPVVADVGELAEMVCDGVNGYLVTPNDVAAFARHIVSLLEQPLLWSRLSAAAVATARAHVGLERVSGLWRAQLDLIRHG